MDAVSATGRFSGALPAGVPAPTTAAEKALWDQSKDFEAVFVRQLVSQMLDAARGESEDGANAAYQSMADESMTQGLVDSGSFGLAGSLYGFLRTQASSVPLTPAADAGTGPDAGSDPGLGDDGVNDTAQPLRDLIATLREQAGRLETLLELTEAQTSAIATRDIEGIGRLTATIEREVVDGATVEERRAGFAAELAAALGRTDGDITVSGLADSLGPVEGRALRMAADAVVHSVQRLGRQSTANRSLLEHELTVIDQVMRLAHRGERVTYSGRGAYDRETVAILDAKA